MTNRKKPKARKEKNATRLIEDAEQIRKQMDKKVFRREDGILQCPTAYAEGFGIQDRKSGL